MNQQPAKTTSSWTFCPECKHRIPRENDAPSFHNHGCKVRRQLLRAKTAATPVPA